MLHFKNRNSLINFIKNKTERAVLLANLPNRLPSQKGETGEGYALSKLYALRNAIALYEKFIPNFHPHVRKADLTIEEKQAFSSSRIFSREVAQGKSLRYQAKEYRSRIGEIYNPETLSQLAKNNQMSETCFYPQNNPEEYIKKVKEIIDANHAALVFYDIEVQGKEKGKPIKAQGCYEYGACIVGYCYQHETLYFIACQWGKFYLHPAVDIAHSALQINPQSTETFYKLNLPPSTKPEWIEKNALDKIIGEKTKSYKNNTKIVSWVENYFQNRVKKKRTATHSGSHTPLGKYIFDIHSNSQLRNAYLKSHFESALTEFEKYIKTQNSAALNNLLVTLRSHVEKFIDDQRKETTLTACLEAIGSARKEGHFDNDKPLFNIMRNILLGFAIVLSFGIAALIRRDYSYRTMGHHSIFENITKPKQKAYELEKILLQHKTQIFDFGSGGRKVSTIKSKR